MKNLIFPNKGKSDLRKQTYPLYENQYGFKLSPYHSVLTCQTLLPTKGISQNSSSLLHHKIHKKCQRTKSTCTSQLEQRKKSEKKRNSNSQKMEKIERTLNGKKNPLSLAKRANSYLLFHLMDEEKKKSKKRLLKKGRARSAPDLEVEEKKKNSLEDLSVKIAEILSQYKKKCERLIEQNQVLKRRNEELKRCR